ncbi:hypothetical protein DFJ73DRAFT_217847 [Zopfochytrium polystomum]|nr:hypothetical protein DFJ73DRAFT_218971 [Zopfochytrium polystomum]KAI9325322.1 hypothetical protein DFJ73DRAFT_217847 [Zopfochytrium polystomum]
MVVTNIKYASVYPENSAVTLQISTTPCGDLAQYDVVRNRYLLVAPMNLTIESTVFQYSAGVPMADREAVLPFASGDINNYPFEVFESNVFQVTASNGTSRIGVEVRLTVSSQNFTSNVEELLDISDAGDGTVVSVKVVVQRSFATKAVSIFVMFAMWLLSGFAIALAVTPWILHQKVESPAIIFVLALLFSLPQIRNVQPGVPAVGCTSDVVSFFWSMVLASVSAALLMLSYIYHSSKLLKLD